MSVSGELADGNSKLTFTVTSTNTGDVAGKDVIELYVTLPYIQGGIEKSRVQLVDFAKTPLLQPDSSHTVTFTVDAYDLASYDYNDANGNGETGYELDAGDYIFYAAKNSHVDGKSNVYAQAVVTLANEIILKRIPIRAQ